MADEETGTEWSHLLGKAMRGPLQGTELEPLPSTMTTWEAWKREHPKTTVLNLSQTADRYIKQFYSRPNRFVFGWVHGREHVYFVEFPQMLQQDLMNITTTDAQFLLTFDRDSTAANLFLPELDGDVLTFGRTEPGRMEDLETFSVWNSQTGVALSGPLEGRRLEQLVGIMSFARAWKIFHPDSIQVKPR